jgi:hypothetical protein
MVPSQEKPDYKELKRKLIDFKQTNFVDDSKEIAQIIAE